MTARGQQLRVLVVAGEESGDNAAAAVVQTTPMCAFGIGGPRLVRAGLRALPGTTFAPTMGFSAVLPKLANAYAQRKAVLTAARRERPDVALLVNYSDFNASLLAPLRVLGVPTIFYAPPQAWAWRPRRADAIARAATCLAVMFPFERAFWQNHGANVRYVGHPAACDWDAQRVNNTPFTSGPSPADASGRLRCALLPGSRPGEVSAHLAILLRAVALARARQLPIDFTCVVAESLPERVRAAVDTQATASGVTMGARGGMVLRDRLRGADLAIAVSGTATLECALAEVPPVIVFRTGAVVAALGRRMLTTSHIGLPNIVLGRRAFPELVGPAVTEAGIVHQLMHLMDHRTEALRQCRILQAKMSVHVPCARAVGALLHEFAR